jgi:hypothetical protein
MTGQGAPSAHSIAGLLRAAGFAGARGDGTGFACMRIVQGRTTYVAVYHDSALGAQPRRDEEIAITARYADALRVRGCIVEHITSAIPQVRVIKR